MKTNRRNAIKLLGSSVVATLAALTPIRLVRADTHNDARLAVVVLRGGLDSLHALVPYADPDYYRLRPRIAVPPPGQENGALRLNGQFGLHPAMKNLHQLFERGEMTVIPAATTSYRKRSHFDAQNQLENGSDKPFGIGDGWLNRTISLLTADEDADDERLGLAVGTATPLIMYGPSPVRTWAPTTLPSADEDFLMRLAQAYEPDPKLHAVLQQAIATRIDPTIMGSNEQSRKRVNKSKLTDLARTAGKLMAQENGPRIAVFESNGWDTHTGQVNRMNRQLRVLDNGIASLQQALGESWKKTVVLVVTEFGRTVSENGSRGTDHGIASLALLAGGAVRGGKIIGQWPGLASGQLYEGRDLQPTTDYAAVFKSVLNQHLGLSESVIDQKILVRQQSTALRDLIHPV